jgi:ABC-type branched-subunit amino acid transport system substrate-binding protein
MSPRSWGRRRFLSTVGGGALTLALGDLPRAAGVEGALHRRPGSGLSTGALRTVRIGCILPTGETGGRGLEAGILLGREEAEQVGALLGVELEVLEEQVGGPEEAEAAVTRLLDAGVQGLVGGMEASASGEAGRMAAREGIPFVDALPWSDASGAGAATDAPCARASFRLGVDPATGLGLVLEALTPEAPSGPFVLVGDPRDPLVVQAREVLGSGPAPRLLDAGTPAEALSAEIRSLSVGGSPEGVRVLLVGPRALAWASSPDARGTSAPVFATTPLQPAAQPVIPVHAPALWHPALVRFGATQLSERHERRFGTPMDSPAWAGWFAVKVLWEVVLREGGEERGDLPAGRLADPAKRFDGHKGVGLGFRADGLLRQPLYLVRTDPGGSSEVVHEGPAAPAGTPFAAAFDALGPPGTPCRSGRASPARPAPPAP